MIMPHGSSDIPSETPSLDAPCIAAFLEYFIEYFFLLPNSPGNVVDKVVAGREGLR